MVMIRQLIRSINHNPNTYYLNSVQELTLGSPYGMSLIEKESNTVFDLILRFPNLKSVKLYNNEYNDPLVTFNDNDQQDLLAKRCPKFERLEYEELSVLKKKYSLTWIDLTHMSRLDDIEVYLANFPHLQAAWCEQGNLDSFEKCVPLIERLPALIDIVIGRGRDEEETRKVLQKDIYPVKQKTNKVCSRNGYQKLDTLFQAILVTNICVNGAKFILRYLTGFKYLSLYCYDKLSWTDEENEVFISLLKYACNLEEFHVSIDDITPAGLSKCLEPLVLLIQSHETDKIRETVVEFSLFDGDDDTTEEDFISIDINMIQDCRSLNVKLRFTISSKVYPYRIIDLFESVSQLDHISSFIFGTAEVDPQSDTYKPGYDDVVKAITRRIPSLSQMVFDIPTIIGEDLDFHDTNITSLTLRQTGTLTEEALIKPILLFEELRKLEMFYFTGVWRAYLHEFQINLGFCNLELKVDLTRVKCNMEGYNKDAFILIEVKIFEKSKRRLYRAPTNLLDTAEITDASLEGLTRGKDYIVVHVMINTLKSLDIFIDRMRRGYGYYDAPEAVDLLYINLFNDKDTQIPKNKYDKRLFV